MFSRAKKTPVAEWWWTIDRELLGALVLLLLCGVVLSFAASPPVAERLGLSSWHFVIRHWLFAIPTLVVLIGASFLSVRQARVAALVVLVGAIVLLVATLQFGIQVKGSRRWISILGISLQPSEFVKPAYAVIAAWLFAEKMKHPDMPAQIIASALMVLIAVLLMLQPDFGQTVLMVVTWAALLFLAGISWWLIGLLMGVAAAGAGLAYLVFPHIARRIDIFINPESGDNYQMDRALQSLLEGGWFGRGPGEAIVRRYVPDAHADFVFSAAAGEFGILFCLVLVGLIGFITLRALFLAQQQTGLFARLAASTLAIQFGVQSGINLAVNLNLLPPKGMTLPFVSYGGTSMLATAFAMGLVLALTRRKPEERLATGIPRYRNSLAQGA
ncbi:MAG: putative lipid II flippase FtsW [Devosiaceae bacterium]|nr:putative lipid II flippase FtsW [Devosiaceae bacterium]